ncbi:hypothetical protein J3A84_08710 [Proteiniclasticum sp. SCR006]|uniref:Uncharacterized protein n=1 Tax=Proteiniclasticum aestuarii TaxID=2817862 RepID=A0A939H6I2_9CLOT|nr:hypothetical protein [Proteiniclasticum aestuarii]MBO1265104.1 hypothetical protein [Proteiniclasticum aestuarii]
MEFSTMILTKYILGFALQSFILVLGVYIFNKQKLILRDYLITSVLVTFVTFFMKSLPISVGVQTIMNMIFMYLICVVYLKMQPYITIRSTALCVVLILISEMIVTAGIVMMYGQTQFQSIVSSGSQRHYIGTMANIVFTIIIIALYFILDRKGEYHRSISKQDS